MHMKFTKIPTGKRKERINEKWLIWICALSWLLWSRSLEVERIVFKIRMITCWDFGLDVEINLNFILYFKNTHFAANANVSTTHFDLLLHVIGLLHKCLKDICTKIIRWDRENSSREKWVADNVSSEYDTTLRTQINYSVYIYVALRENLILYHNVKLMYCI